MTGSLQKLQDVFLNYLKEHKTATTVFLINGVKLQGVITCYDGDSLLLRREAHSQVIYKHAISTIMPNDPIPFFTGAENSPEQAA